jgi:hypothetical protein
VSDESSVCLTTLKERVIKFSHLGDRDQTDYSCLFLNHLLMFISTSFSHRKFLHGRLGTN